MLHLVGADAHIGLFANVTNSPEIPENCCSFLRGGDVGIAPYDLKPEAFCHFSAFIAAWIWGS